MLMPPEDWLAGRKASEIRSQFPGLQGLLGGGQIPCPNQGDEGVEREGWTWDMLLSSSGSCHNSHVYGSMVAKDSHSL